MRSTSKASLPSRICPAKRRDCARSAAFRPANPAITSLSAGPALGSDRAATVQAFFGQRIFGNIDPVEIAVILGAILQVIDDLQRGAQGIIGGPGVPAFAMHVQHEPAHRHGRIAAIIHQIVPVAIAQFGDVAAKGFQKVQRMLVASSPCSASDVAQAPAASGDALLFAHQAWRASLPAAGACPPARRWHDRRCRRRNGRNDKRPGPAGAHGAARSGRTRRENSPSWCPCPIAARQPRSCRAFSSALAPFPSTCRPCPTSAECAESRVNAA